MPVINEPCSIQIRTYVLIYDTRTSKDDNQPTMKDFPLVSLKFDLQEQEKRIYI